MSACTFFGHRDCCADIEPLLVEKIENLIVHKDVNIFYVGDHGSFDRLVVKTLRETKKKHPQIAYQIVLAYMPHKNEPSDETLLPDGIEIIPKRYAISYRNQWMIQHSDYVIAYVTRSFGGAAQFVEKATKAEKVVINIAKS